VSFKCNLHRSSAVCDFLVNRPELMEELEARVGGAKVGLSLTLNSVDP
jgi:hypothetical protein